MPFEPLADRVLLRKAAKQEKTTTSGIILPAMVQEDEQHALVVAVGPGALNDRGELIAMNVKVGDTVLLGKWSGTDIKIGEEKMLIVSEKEILGVMRP